MLPQKGNKNQVNLKIKWLKMWSEVDFDIPGPGAPLTFMGPLCKGGFEMVCLVELCRPPKCAGLGARAPCAPPKSASECG